MAAHFLSRGACTSRSAGAAAKLPGSERKKLAVQALAGSEPISELSARLGVSRKFVYAHVDEAVKQHQAKRALELLAAARLCHLVRYSAGTGIPLTAATAPTVSGRSMPGRSSLT